MSNRCPVCDGRAVGQIGVDQFYCWDCFIEFNASQQVFEIAEDGSLMAYGSGAQVETAVQV